MTQSDLPPFSLPTSEEMKSATERLTNFWIGACSPMWVPFFAATSFGVSAWMLTGAAARGATGNDLYKDLPKGFVDMMSLRQSWYKASEEAAHVIEDVNEVVRDAAAAAIEAESAVIEALTEPLPVAKPVEPAPLSPPAIIAAEPEALAPARAEPVEDVLPEHIVEPAFEPVPVIKAAPKRRPAPRK
ncbi:hypothetical protein [Asticcacaulis sp. AND118]|uniref:hypothetical protein n=1 Tax=Asticcacaulis sp. AND118 TaxID=2840468 RepID=UPI001CFFA244|nr:hypothetical protein [Asticcacaulis sp. AND118]UDF02611.1 hypothetical protein LH365_09210 [Asticcacaulis sp. AND118]